jgi:hypothetical protein
MALPFKKTTRNHGNSHGQKAHPDYRTFKTAPSSGPVPRRPAHAKVDGMRIWTLLLCLIAFCPIGEPATAQVPATVDLPQTGNLPADFYPRSKCVRPDASKVDRLAYSETIRYNRQIKEYNACNKDYLANARNDVDSVLAMINAQVAIANSQPPLPAPSAPSNLPAGFYPAANCVKPDKAAIGEMPSTQKIPVVSATGKPKTADGQQALDTMAAYNARVTLYNLQAVQFSACSKDYIAKGRIDMAHIQAASQAMIKAAE